MQKILDKKNIPNYKFIHNIFCVNYSEINELIILFLRKLALLYKVNMK